MSRILAVDYGKARTGLAVTDELRIIANPLTTVETLRLFEFLDNYLKENKVGELVVGLPMRMHGEVGELEEDIQKFIKKFQKKHPLIPVFREDEMFTSKMASQAIFAAGAKKKKRRDKKLVDKVAAVLILQSYMESKGI